MTYFEKIVTPFFIDSKITPQRLYDSSSFTLAQLISFNTAGEFDDIISQLTDKLKDLDIDLGGIDQGTNIQKNKTATNDQVLAFFKKTMGEKKGAIADKLGGFNTDEFRLFYPRTRSDYPKANKTSMPMLTKRVHDVATTYTTQLGTDLSTLLISFLDLWKNSRASQSTQIGIVEDSRIEKTPAMTGVNNIMKKVIGLLWVKYEGDDLQTTKYFDFTKLYNTAHHKHEILTGSLAAIAQKTLSNEAFGDLQKIKGRNTSTNATFIIYIVANPMDIPTKFVTVKPGKSFSKLATEFGDLDGTFLIIKNISEINEVSYLVEFTD